MKSAPNILILSCPKCGQDKSCADFYRNKNRKTGHDSMCKLCRNAYNKRRRNSPKGDHDRARKRKWAAANRDSVCAQTKAWKEANVEHVAAYNARYFQENKSRLMQAHQRRVEADPERFHRYARESYCRYAEQRKKAVAAYRQTERGRAVKARAAHKRRSRFLKAGEMPSIEALCTLRESSVFCPYCACEMVGGYLSPNEKTLDHKIPLSRGGTNALSNLECVCRSCNTRKSALTDLEFKTLLAGEGA